MRIVLTCDAAMAEAAEAREPGDYLVQIREWAGEGIRQIAERAGALDGAVFHFTPDAIKDAIAEGTEAAIRGDEAGYKAARAKEAEARAAA